MTHHARDRALYTVLALLTILAGLWLHGHGLGLSAAMHDVSGDALWAVMIAWWVGAIAPTARLGARTAAALAICTADELSQLIHTPSLDAVRSTTLGQLVLGSGFDARDLVAYAAGALAAAVLESVVRIWLARRRT